MTEIQTGYASFSPYNSHYFAPDYIRIQRWGEGYTAVVMTDTRTYRLFSSDIDDLWQQIKGVTNDTGIKKAGNGSV
uniref:Uncharacterized protein n=1 Tax=viral metagenome TaxID=1070528 RepID=A0A6H1ZHH9_9ZZZZ